MSVFLSLREISKRFGEQAVLESVTLAVDEGEVLVLLGPSGSGKTTLLRIIAGFEQPDTGEVEAGGEAVTAISPDRRGFGMVFQHYALFPHLSVGDNVAFGLASRGLSRDENRERVDEVLALVDLPGFAPRRVHEISGGQQQRVALARALAPDPRLLLLDEPLSNLDPSLRERTRQQLKETLNRVGITAVWVTHEQEEAFDVGDRVAVLDRGHLQQVGRPEELYLEPRSRFVAEFVGRASVLAGELLADGRVRIGDPRFFGQGVEWPGETLEELAPGAAVDLLFRPDSLELAGRVGPEGLAGTVSDRRYAGEATYYRIILGSGEEILVRGGVDACRIGERVVVELRPEGPPARIFGRSGEMG